MAYNWPTEGHARIFDIEGGVYVSKREALDGDPPLYCVRLDDRGDVGLFVWDGSESDAFDAAEEWVADHYDDGVFDPEEFSVTSVEDPDVIGIVWKRSHR